MPENRPPSILQLLTSTIDNARRLGQAQVALVKAELVADGTAIAQTGILGIVAVGSVGLAAIFLLVTIAYVFVQLGLPIWAGFALVTLLLLITAAVTGYLAYRRAQTIKGPQRAVQEVANTQRALGIQAAASQAKSPRA